MSKKKTWYFTIERDVPISAFTEEDAEKIFRERYGNTPVLGIIRPHSSGGKANE